MAHIEEKHYTVKQLAESWGLSVKTIHRLFDGEPGVLRIGKPSRRLGRKLTRSYFTLRIPESTVAKVYARQLGKAGAA